MASERRPRIKTLSKARKYSFHSMRKQDPESPPSRVLAAPDGSIVFEWQSGSKIVEVEIDAPGRANYMLEEAGKSPRFWTGRF